MTRLKERIAAKMGVHPEFVDFMFWYFLTSYFIIVVVLMSMGE